jgi:Pyruvate/2-oxoacid:ferredoxin oxidoreductase delta subunit
MGVEQAAERRRNFREVELGLPSADEARRCLSCGACTRCDRCLWFCPEGVVRRAPSGCYEIDERYCKGCGICAAECPRAGLAMEAECC